MNPLTGTLHMLLSYSQFIQRQGVKSPVYLLNPPAVLQSELQLPRQSVLHYLELSQDNHFPERTLNYFNGIKESKRIPIFTVMDLAEKDRSMVVENKRAAEEVRRWVQNNLRQFQVADLLKAPNKDEQAISVFNYNLLKDLYKQREYAADRYRHFWYLQLTYWHHVAAAAKLDPTAHQIVPIDIPAAIPSREIFDRLLTLSPVQLMRVVTDPRLLRILDLYCWLNEKDRMMSTMKGIDLSIVDRITLELRTGGYSCFLPLELLSNLSTESSVKSTQKLEPKRLRKLLLVFLRKLQQKVVELAGDDTPPVEKEDELEDLGGNEDIEGVIETESTVPTISGLQPELNVQSLDDKLIIASADSDLNSLLDEDTGDDIFDAVFEKKIAAIGEEKPGSAVKRLIEQLDEPAEEEPEPVALKPYSEDEVHTLLRTPSATEQLDQYIDNAIAGKTLTSAEIRALRKLKEARALVKNPYNDKESLDAFVTKPAPSVALSKEAIQLPISNPLVAEDLKTDVLAQFNTQYLNTAYKKDVVACIQQFEHADIIIKDWRVEKVTSAVDHYELHSLTVKPLRGKESQIYFRLPVISRDNTFVSSGIEYAMKKQRIDLPIRKVSPIKVALTSNYGKLFIGRTERKANDPIAYIVKYIQSDYLGERAAIKRLVPAGKRLNHLKLPNIYSALASRFNEIQIGTDTLLLNPDDVKNHIKPEVVKALEEHQLMFCGYRANKHILAVDQRNVFYDYSNNLERLGTIDELLQLDKDKLPRAFSTLRVLGDEIPLGVCLGYYLGLSGLIAATQTNYQIIGPRQQYRPSDDELVLRFADCKLVLATDTEEKKLLLAGFLYFKDITKLHPLALFDDQDVYLPLLEHRGSKVIHLKELVNLKDLFIDPITKDVLLGMDEPTDFLKLLLRANELLSDFSHPDVNDSRFIRVRGFDRIPGLMYRAIAEGVREHRIKGRASAKISVDPYKVWNAITQDNTVKITENINPVLNAKENEGLTIAGAEGLSKGAVPMALRRYHPSDAGLISEGTVDSSDVAINTYLTPYAKLNDIRGTVKTDAGEVQQNPMKLFSTAALLSPMTEHDD